MKLVAQAMATETKNRSWMPRDHPAGPARQPGSRSSAGQGQAARWRMVHRPPSALPRGVKGAGSSRSGGVGGGGRTSRPHSHCVSW